MDSQKPKQEILTEALNTLDKGDTAQAAAYVVAATPDRQDRAEVFEGIAQATVTEPTTMDLERATRRDLIIMAAEQRHARRRLGKKALTQIIDVVNFRRG